MGYTVDLQAADLSCRTEADAHAATALVARHAEMCPYHLEVSPCCHSNPARDDAWVLSVEHFQGDHWNNEHANRLWEALAAHLADGATIEFQGSDGTRWRIRWNAGRVFEEYVVEVIWSVEGELQPPLKGSTP